MTRPDWLRVFLPLGSLQGDRWDPCGGGVLLLDASVVWLVTATSVLETVGDHHVATWVPGTETPRLFDLTLAQQGLGIGWIHHPAGIGATPFPIAKDFGVKAFGEAQCTSVRALQPLQPCVSLGCPHSPEFGRAAFSTPAVCDGVVSYVDARSGFLHTTAPLLPRNAGAPLLIASPYGGDVTLAGILLGNTLLSDVDPRALPVRLTRAICVDAALELVRGAEARAMRAKTTSKPTEAS